jgi:hypothetical protein
MIVIGIVFLSRTKQKAKIVVYESRPKAEFRAGPSAGIVVDNRADHTFMAKKTGNKYHRPNCMVLAKARKRDLVNFDSKAEAEAKGFRPCKICVE